MDEKTIILPKDAQLTVGSDGAEISMTFGYDGGNVTLVITEAQASELLDSLELILTQEDYDDEEEEEEEDDFGDDDN